MSSLKRPFVYKEHIITIPTLFTIVRFILVPVVLCMITMHYWIMSLVLFLFAAITDVIDGYLARRWNQQTRLGAILDPVADKLLVVSIFSVLSVMDQSQLPIPRWFIVSLIVKELVLLVGGFLLLSSKRSFYIQPTFLGKMTALIQMIAIAWVFVCYIFNWLPYKTWYSCLLIMFVLQMIVLTQYMIIGLRRFRELI